MERDNLKRWADVIRERLAGENLPWPLTVHITEETGIGSYRPVIDCEDQYTLRYIVYAGNNGQTVSEQGTGNTMNAAYAELLANLRDCADRAEFEEWRKARRAQPATVPA